MVLDHSLDLALDYFQRALAIDYQFRLELDKNLQIGAVAAK